ncbi:L-rhamnose-binding lectin SML-like [Takifugu rubripes]|uniref:L-rhamnose-binding lectin SML-like n=1 Tax=Takifugu rubripes TaxID=31033 RepID=UPI0011457A13|nr:L-rhamnose-binding lectin SML-like [Takifugu rubripes]
MDNASNPLHIVISNQRSLFIESLLPPKCRTNRLKNSCPSCHRTLQLLTWGEEHIRCDGKKECEINIRDVATPDPCVGTFKYLDTNYTCLPAIHVVACEGSLAHLFCAEGQVISVYGADYGRRDETTCNGKNRCTFRVGSSLFGDPCRNTYKYLELAYVCEYPVIVPYEHYSPE